MVAAVAWLLTLAPGAQAAMMYDTGRAALERGDYAQAEQFLKTEIEQNPGHEEAYQLWAQALEELGNREAARDAWKALKEISVNDELRTQARKEMLRLNRELTAGGNDKRQRSNPFKMNLEIDYTGLEEVEGTNYRGVYPPFTHETRNFTVYTCNEKLARAAAKVCDQSLAHLQNMLLAGRAWAIRVPILIYADHDD